MSDLQNTIITQDRNVLIAENERYCASSNHGKTTEWVLCRFCNTKTLAYTWSLAGSGKKCDTCKDTLHTMTGSAMRFKNSEDVAKKLESFNQLIN